MIKERIILLTDIQQAELIKKMKAANMDDDLAILQQHINEWLKPNNGIADALAKEISEAKRLSHKEK